MPEKLEVPDLEIEELDDKETSSQDASGEENTSGQGDDESSEDDKSKKITVPNLSDDDLSEVASVLSGQGINKGNVNQLMTNNQAYQRMLYLMENDPTQLLSMVEQVNPRAAKNLMEKITDAYIDRYDNSDEDDDDRGKRGNRGRGSRQQNNPELRQVMEAVQRLQNRFDAGDQATQYEALRKSFESKVNQYFDAGDLKDLPAKDKRALKALLKESLAEDPKAYANIQKGRFVDIPSHLQKVLDDWTTDTTGEESNQKTERGRVRDNARREVTVGAGNETGGESRGVSTDDDWEGAVKEIAHDLNKARAKRK